MKRIVFPCLLAAACVSPGSPPYLISVTPDGADPNLVRLDWARAGGHVTRTALDWRIPGGPFSESPFDPERGGIDLTAFAPDSGDVELRLRAEPGARGGNVVRYHRGFFATEVTVRPVPDSSSAFAVTYTNRSTTGAAARLERRTVQLDGTASAWSQVDSGVAASNTYSDHELSQWIDGAHYEYRASIGAQPPSKPALTFSAWLLAPELVSFNPPYTLVIRGTSRYSTSIAIAAGHYSATPSPLGSVPAPAAGATVSFTSTALQPGVWNYQLQATATGGPSSQAVTGFLAVSDPSSPLVSSVQPLQRGDDTFRDGAGRFAPVETLTEGYNPKGVALFPPGGGAPLVIDAKPHLNLIVDAAGHPHTACSTANGNYLDTTLAPILHVWHDGTRWQTEEIARRAFVTSIPQSSGLLGIAFDLGLDGTLFAAWTGKDGIEVASKAAGGAWTVQSVPGMVEFPLGQQELTISGDEQGVPHVILLGFSSSHFYPAGGAWQKESLPLAGVVEYDSYGARAFAGPQGNLLVFAKTYGTREIKAARRNAGGWSAPVVLTIAYSMSAARSADGTAIALASSDGSLWLERNGASTTSHFDVIGFPSVGFGLADKAWVLDWLTPRGMPTEANPLLPGFVVVYDER